MAKYNTGNPVGSADPRDRNDNSQVFDNLVSGDQKSYKDRLGKNRKSWAGMNSEFDSAQISRDSAFDISQNSRTQQFQADQLDRNQRFTSFIASSGYVGTGANGAIEDYVAGIEITEYNQIIRDSTGEFWRLSGTTTIPYATTGSGLPEGGALVGVGDAVLRQEIADSAANDKGASLVGYRGETVSDVLTRSPQLAASRGGVVAFVFDDGYESNYSNALPVFRKYGFAATVAQEVERIGQDYNGDPAYPVLTTEHLRELIDSGWEVCNHPDLILTDGESQMVASAQAENQLLIDLLTGAKVKNYSTGEITTGTVTHPQFSNYRITSAVYRGGARNETSDTAYRFVYDKVRSINGTVAERGDFLYAFSQYSERTTQMSAFPVDTTSNSIEKSLAFIDSVAQSNSTAIIYAHDVPDGVGGATPWISKQDLDSLLARCKELGVQVIPLRNLFKGNAISDSRFEFSTGSFSARTGDTAEFDATDTLNSQSRCVHLQSIAHVANQNTGYSTAAFVSEPFCRYRVRVRHKIDVDLDILGAGNRNHGLNVTLNTLEANTSGNSGGTHSASNLVLNDPDVIDRLPYQATAGYEEYSVILVTGYGNAANVNLSLYNCTGSVRIGQIIVEKLDSIIAKPLSGSQNFNTSLGRDIYLPTPGSSIERPWRWQFEVKAAPLTFTQTFDYAFTDPANITSPQEGETCYIIDEGVGSFSGHGGQLATFSSGSWSFSDLTSGVFFKVINAQGKLNRYFQHLGRRFSPASAPIYRESFISIIDDTPIIDKESEGRFSVYNESGTRVDAFTWTARPIGS